MDAVVRPFSGERTPKSFMLTSVARVLQRTHKKCGVDKEMKGWRVRENLTPSSDDEEESSNKAESGMAPRKIGGKQEWYGDSNPRGAAGDKAP